MWTLPFHLSFLYRHFTIHSIILNLCVFLDSFTLKLRVCIPLETWIDTSFYGVVCEWCHCSSASSPTLGYRFPVSIRSFQIYFPIWVQFGSSDMHTSTEKCFNHTTYQLPLTNLTLLTYLLTAWCRFLLEKLTGLELVKKFPAFHGTRIFITALTSVRQLSLSWASPNQSIYPHHTSWRSILILSTHLRLGLPSGLLPHGLPTKNLYTPLFTPVRVTCSARLK